MVARAVAKFRSRPHHGQGGGDGAQGMACETLPSTTGSVRTGAALIFAIYKIDRSVRVYI